MRGPLEWLKYQLEGYRLEKSNQDLAARASGVYSRIYSDSNDAVDRYNHKLNLMKSENVNEISEELSSISDARASNNLYRPHTGAIGRFFARVFGGNDDRNVEKLDACVEQLDNNGKMKMLDKDIESYLDAKHAGMKSANAPKEWLDVNREALADAYRKNPSTDYNAKVLELAEKALRERMGARIQANPEMGSEALDEQYGQRAKEHAEKYGMDEVDSNKLKEMDKNLGNALQDLDEVFGNEVEEISVDTLSRDSGFKPVTKPSQQKQPSKDEPNKSFDMGMIRNK